MMILQLFHVFVMIMFGCSSVGQGLPHIYIGHYLFVFPSFFSLSWKRNRYDFSPIIDIKGVTDALLFILEDHFAKQHEALVDVSLVPFVCFSSNVGKPGYLM